MKTKALIKRPVLRYHGGKWKLAPWIISHFPRHRIYVEPFGGAASVLMRKARSYGEVYNDRDGDVVNLFRVLRDLAKSEQLKAALSATPYARDEFFAAYEFAADPVERARRMVVRSFMGFGSASSSRDYVTGFRSNCNRSGTTPAQDWAHFSAHLDAFCLRLQGVTIENRDASKLMREHDSEQTLHYVDPPYVHETRNITKNNHCYRYEMTNEEHVALLEQLEQLKGFVVLSGYDHPIYSELEKKGWLVKKTAAMADGAKKRTEVLWISPRTAAATLNLF